jgi:hypothetical protein
VVPSDLAGLFTNEAASIPDVKVVTTTAHGLPHETTTRGKQPDALITVQQVDRQPALDNIAGFASRDYDFDEHGVARVPKGTALRYSTTTLQPLASHIHAVYTQPARLRHRCKASTTRRWRGLGFGFSLTPLAS